MEKTNALQQGHEIQLEPGFSRFKTFDQEAEQLLQKTGNSAIVTFPSNAHCPKCKTARQWLEDQTLHYRWQCQCGKMLPQSPKASVFVEVAQAPVCKDDAKGTLLVITTQAAPCGTCLAHKKSSKRFSSGADLIKQVQEQLREDATKRGTIKRQMRAMSGLQKHALIWGEVPKFLPRKLLEEIVELASVDKYVKKSYFQVLLNLALGWEVFGEEFQGINGMSRQTKESALGKLLAHGNSLSASSLCERLQDPRVIQAASYVLAVSGLAAGSDAPLPVYFVDSMWLILKGDSYEFAQTHGSAQSHAIKVSLLRDLTGAILNVCVHSDVHPSDQACLQEHLMSWQEPAGALFIFDRGYEDLKFFEKMQERHYFFIMLFEEEDFRTQILEKVSFAPQDQRAKLPKKGQEEAYFLLSQEIRLIGTPKKLKMRTVSFQRRTEKGEWTVRKIMSNKLLSDPQELVSWSFLRWKIMESGYDCIKNRLGVHNLKVKNGNSALSLLLLLLAGVNLLMLCFRHVHAEHGGEFVPQLAKGTLRVWLEWFLEPNARAFLPLPACTSPTCPYKQRR